METVEDLKKDIQKKNALVKIEQSHIKEKIDNGLFDDVDEVLEEKNNYYREALTILEQEQIENLQNAPKDLNEGKKSLWSKFKKNLKTIILK